MKQTNKPTSKNTQRSPRDLFLIIIILIFGLGIVVTGLIFIVTRPDSNSAASVPKEISVNEAFELYQTGTLIVDVREKSEWKEIHVPNTVHIPLGDLEKRSKELPTNQEIVVICRSGNRSQTGRNILLEKGFNQVTSVTGGIKDWTAAGYPTVSGE